MGGKRRNQNKKREDFVISGPARKNRVNSTSNYESDVESCLTQLTIDDDSESDTAEVVVEDTVDLGTSTIDIVKESLDNALSKSVSVRLAALDNLITVLSRNCISQELIAWKMTVSDVIQRSIKKGGEECCKAARLAAILSFQLGEESDEEMDELADILRPICMDDSLNEKVRKSCIESLATITLFSIQQTPSIEQTILAFRSIWMNTKMNTTSSVIFCSSLCAWSLLVQHSDRKILQNALLDQPKLSTFIDGNEMEMRVRTGEALAALHEAAIDMIGTDFRFANQQHILEKITKLSTVSLKSVGKRDRRAQRYSFRQIFGCINDQQPPLITIKLTDEILNLDSCKKKLVYDTACGVLHDGLLAHLKSNIFLRDNLDMGPVQVAAPPKLSKIERIAVQKVTTKARHMKRLKERDKRSFK